MKYTVRLVILVVFVLSVGQSITVNSTPAILWINPSSPAIGQEVFVEGYGFNPMAGDVYFYLVDGYGGWHEIGFVGGDHLNVNNKGEVTGSFYTPAHNPEDYYYILAVQSETGITASHPFGIVWINIVISPTEGKPGTEVTIEGYGFGQGMANQLWSAYFDNIPLFINQYTDGSRIQFSRTFQVPQVEPRTHTIQAIDHFYGLSMQVDFTVKGKGPQWELYIEIDYLEGHRPSAFTEKYIEEYYGKRGIDLDIIIDDLIPMTSNAEDGITQAEYWDYESVYNDVIYEDDRKLSGKVTDSKEKWVLYGTWWFDAHYVVYGQCDANWLSLTECGNYIFVADEANDYWVNYWADTSKKWEGISDEIIETVILMHEIGHSIGILEVEWVGIPPYPEEVYDDHKWSVMSRADFQTMYKSCKALKYSSEYWKLKNLGYYEK